MSTQYFSKSDKAVWWICPKDERHVYDMRIANRTSVGSNCPFCSSKRVNESNSLQSCFPNVAIDWHPTKNGDLMSSDVIKASRKKVWWLCPNNHQFKMSIQSRTLQSTPCPYCSGRRKRYKNSLKS